MGGTYFGVSKDVNTSTFLRNYYAIFLFVFVLFYKDESMKCLIFERIGLSSLKRVRRNWGIFAKYDFYQG